MKAKEQIIEELENLDPEDMLRVYDLILTLKPKYHVKKKKKPSLSYQIVRKELKDLKGSLCEDILWTREDRL